METFIGIEYNTWWFLLLGAVVTGYAILDGFDMGVGAIHLFLGKKRESKSSLKCHWTCLGWQ